MNYSLCDSNCPYNINNCNSFTSVRRRDQNNPLELEDNDSKTLLVFEAPGYYEWINQSPIYDSRQLGMENSAGSKIADAFEQCNKNRMDYDIAEAVSCFPGTKSNLIQDEVCQAAKFCEKYLMSYIYTKKYSKIVCWGYIAHNSVVNIVNILQERDHTYCPSIIFAKHPTAKDVTPEYIVGIIKKHL